MKKQISCILAFTIIFSSIHNFAYALSDNNYESNEGYTNDSSYTELAAETEVLESVDKQEIVMEEQAEENIVDLTPTPIPDYYIMEKVTERNVKIHVDQDNIPVGNISVSLNDNKQMTDENGDVLFENVSVSDEKYQLVVKMEDGERIERSISVRGVVFLPDESEEIPAQEINVSFQNKNEPSAMNEYEYGYNDWQYDGKISDKIGENFSTAVGTYIYTIEKYNPDAMYVYNTNRRGCTVIDTVPSEMGTLIGIASDNDYVYVLSASKVFRYAIEIGTWSVWESNQNDQDCFFVRNGSLYGINDYEVMIYNSTSKKWSTSFILPEEIQGTIKYAYMEGNTLYCYAYRSYMNDGNSLYKYNVSTKKLSCSSDNDITRNGYISYIACGKGNKIYMVGGERASLEEIDDGYFDEYGEWVQEYLYEWVYEPWSSCYKYDFNDDTLVYIPDIYTESSSHSAVVCNGKLYAIGGNEFQSDTGSVIYSYELNDVHLTVPEIEERTSAEGEDHILTINSDKTVSASGKNTYGQLGIGNTIDSDTPQLVKNLTDVASVYVGDGFSAALKYDGTVWMWGKNDCGQTGIEDSNGTMTPHKVEGLSNIVKLAAGKNHMLALKADGTVFAWGGDEYSELGNLEYDDPSWVPNQVNVSENIKVDIAAGDEHSVVLDAHGYAYVWGNNEKGQIAQSPTEVSFSRNAVKVEVDNVVSIAAGYNHTMLLCDDGSVYTFGDNQYGQLGDGSNVGYSFTPLKINSINAQRIEAEKDSAYAWDSSGVEYKWGLIKDKIKNEYTPNRISYPYKIVQADSYRNQTLAIDELGQVIAWGEGYFADGTESSAVRSYPTKINGIDNPVQVSRGKNHNLVLDKNGDVWGWGSNSNNPMGKLSGKVKTATKIDGISNVKEVAAGTEFSLFLKEDGTLWGIGKNDQGQLGQGNNKNSSVPVQITAKSDFKTIRASEIYAAAIAEDGLYVWGGNDYYQIGLENREDCLTPTKLDIELGNDEYFTDISCGIDFCLALTNLGNVYAWGDNGSGSLGQRGEHKTPSKIETLSNIYRISAGKKSALAIGRDGTVYGWGYGYDGQLGYLASSEFVPKEVTLLSGKEISSVTCGYSFSMAVGKDGSIYSFGDCKNGQLGVYANVPVAYIENVKEVNESVEGADNGEISEYNVSVLSGEAYVLEFTAKKSGTYTFSTVSDNNEDLIVAAYKDKNFNMPYKQTSGSGTIQIGIEKGDTVYLRYVNTKNTAYQAKILSEQTSEIVEDNKTIYIILYDSLIDRYYDNEQKHYAYTEEFFEQYLSLLKDKNVAFVLSEREADFNKAHVDKDSFSTQSVEVQYDKLEAHSAELSNEVSECYNNILGLMYEGYNKLNTNARPDNFPKIYLGTPHFEHIGYIDTLSDYQLTEMIGWYIDICDNIYTNVAENNLETYGKYVEGLYYGKEDPFDYINSETEKSNIETLMIKSVSSYIHNLERKMIWFHYTSGQRGQLDKIGNPINIGKDFDGRDLIDVAIIQPNYFYYELNTDAKDIGYIKNAKDIHDSVTNNCVMYHLDDGTLVIPGNSKTTDTKVLFELEMDMSLVAGRINGENIQTPKDKVNKLAIMLSIYKDLIFDTTTAYGLYLGGPNEEGFTWHVLSAKNDNFHSNKNYMTLLFDSGIIRFWEFKNAIEKTGTYKNDASNDYNGKLIYDILYWLVHGHENDIREGMTEEIGDFFGGDNLNVIEGNI